MKKNFAIVDIETTGGSAKREKIIEIAIVIFDGKNIIDSFESLINPQRSIPPFITSITGITNEMIKDAPKFYEIAKNIVDITEDCIFVAHNSRFDYGFIRHEFQELGYTYSRKQLDTVKLFRRFFPGLKSYALGNLIQHFAIETNARHRAMADVVATLKLLKKGLLLPQSEQILSDIFGIYIKEAKLPSGLSYQDIDILPESTGIYYFLDIYDNIIYIGKALNIKKRVKQHFQKITPKTDKFYSTVRKIDYEITGSELIALLKEAEEIKKHKPPINKALRKDSFPYKLYTSKDSLGYLTFKIAKSIKKDTAVLSEFTTRKQAKLFVENTVYNYQLCKKVAGIEYHEGACFEYGFKNCSGACIGLESHENYNKKMILAIEEMKDFYEENFLIIVPGRDKNESAIILVEKNNYAGYAYIDKSETVIYNINCIKNHITPKKYDKDFNKIIKSYIKNSSVKIVKLI